ncbi:MAG: formylmethanofuran dehydrogenase subunit B [Betaproteobacteria bacterium HGW-Betaproteobacteria-8]|nr:MAG: formylmethanofuran dehydrogenase subunit B [Betaproteobacteria bacterium HGW-Betaproteobacteria-8]
MQSSGKSQTDINSTPHEHIACPACGLLCDDLTVKQNASGALEISPNTCAKSVQFFQRPFTDTGPRIAGKPATLDDTIAKAVEILRQANQPLISGLGTEVQGMRAVMSLADKSCASIDHMNSNAFMRNIQVVQNSGWMITTLTEVRNRVDLLVVVGTDIVSLFPRFFERNIWNRESMFGQETSKREVVYLGGRNIDTSAGVAPDGRKPDVLPCDLERLPEVVATLRALINGKRLQVTEVAGIAVAELEKLAERLKAAKYSVIAWATGTLNFPHAELAIQNITELVKDLNQTTRSSGLPLSGNDGEMNANQVSAWISGYPVRTSFGKGHPEYDPHHFAGDRLLSSGEADALLWISSFNPERTPPQTSIPTVVFGHAAMKFDREPEVFIPVGTPGIDHNGIYFRSDNVVSLPLSQLRQSALPSLSTVLTAIEQAL